MLIKKIINITQTKTITFKKRNFALQNSEINFQFYENQIVKEK